MKFNWLWVVAISVIGGGTLAFFWPMQQMAATIAMTELVDLRECKHDEVRAFAFQLRNVGGRSLKVTSVNGGCSCLITEFRPCELTPSQMIEVKGTLRTTAPAGFPFERRIRVDSTDSARPVAFVTVRGKMRDRVSCSPSKIEVLDVVIGDGWERSVLVSATSDEKPFQVTAVACGLGNVTLSQETVAHPLAVHALTKLGNAYRITISQSIVDRFNEERSELRIRTDDPDTPQLTIPIVVQARSAFSRAPNTLLLRPGVEDKLLCKIRGPAAASIRLRSSPEFVDVVALSNPSDGEACWMFEFRLTDRLPSVFAKGEVCFEIEGMAMESEYVVPVCVVPSNPSLALEGNHSREN